MGVGFDQSEVVKADKYFDRFKPDGYIASYNINTGLEYLIKSKDFFEYRFFLRYNFVDYSRKDKTDLTGNYLSLGILIGIYYKTKYNI